MHGPVDVPRVDQRAKERKIEKEDGWIEIGGVMEEKKAKNTKPTQEEQSGTEAKGGQTNEV